jgi:eukaryotic-like serine/threonine-protein kinase
MKSIISGEFTGTNRFLLRRRLGSGGFGVVYHAYDQERQSEVALKLLHKSEATALYQFKQEFRALADITHPNLVTLFELLSEKDYWFFTMALVPGVSFLEYVRGFSANFDNPRTERVGHSTFSRRIEQRQTKDQQDFNSENRPSQPRQILSEPLNLDRLRVALKQLVEGVYALHRFGKLHCDLKPSNVLVSDEGRLVILDFGLITELTSNNKNEHGTPDYMSPEHGAGESLTEASDWYSVGVMLYEALTGQLPFDSSFGDVIKEKLRYEATPPSQLIEGLPEDLDTLCQNLLKRDSLERPTGKEVLKSLGIKTKTQDHKVITLGSQASRLVGRQKHLDKLNIGLQASQTGKTVIRYVSGYSGMGKTVLVRRFLDVIRQKKPEIVIFAGRCYEQESVPYKAFDGIIDDLSQYLKTLVISQIKLILPKDILAIVKLFPVLKQVIEVTNIEYKTIDIPDFQELRRRAFSALRELFSQLSKEKGLVLFIDDLQWGDLDSAALLQELIRPPEPLPLFLIATYRSEERETSPILTTVLSWENQNVDIEEISVEQLSTIETNELITALSDAEQYIPSEQVEMILRESGGSPFFIDELVRYTQIDPSNIIEKPSTITLEQVILARVGQLPVSAQNLLEVLAVAGQPLKRSVAKQAAKLENEEQTALAFLRANHLIRTRERDKKEEIEVYHDRIRETLVDNLAKEKCKNIHHQLALSLEESGHDDPESLATHFQGAGNQEKAAEYTLKAADQASLALAFDHAVNLYKQALALAKKPPSELVALQAKLGNALVNTGRSGEGARIYLKAANNAKAEQALELRRKAAEQFLLGGHIDEGLKVLETVMGSMGIKVPPTPKRALLSLLFRRLQIRLRGLNFKSQTEAEIPANQLLKIDACWSAALGLAIVDTIRGAEFQGRHMLLALAAGEAYRVARALTLEAGFSSTTGSRGKNRTEMLLKMAKELVDKINVPHAQGLFYLMAGIAAFLAGEWLKAHENLEQATSIFSQNCTGVNWEIDNSQLFSLRSLLYLGELNKLCERLPAIVKQAHERGDIYAITSLGTALSYMPCIIEDNPDKARKNMWEAIEKWSHEGFHLQHYWALLGQVQVEIYSGQGNTALKIINAQWSPMVRGLLLEVQNSLIEMLQLRARAALATLKTSNNSKTVLASVEKDAKRLLKEKIATATAFAKLLLAAVAFNRHQKEQAINLLIQAEKDFEQLNMALYKAAVQHRLGSLLEGKKGEELIESANNWMKSQRICNIERMTEMLAPGF